MQDLKRRLRDAAAAHEPDRDGMLERVRHGMSSTPRLVRRAARPLSWPRVTLITLTSTAALVAGGYTIATTVHTNNSGRAAATTPAEPAPPSAADGALTPSTPSTPPVPPRTQDGPLRSDGAVDPHVNAYWSQSDITLQTGAPLDALTLEVRIAQTGGVVSTGAWRTLPEGDFTLTTTDEGGTLTYRWTLKPGRTVPPGQHVFAVQYNHAAGSRPATADAYTATAATRTGQQLTVTGTFRPAVDAKS
ncbi:hypothetical protein AB0O22_15220 [Streptomyces sp. NPDC091204]|uniref:hypothetical protein n=1 Tax=Streptomyces sp. NPDC091204 TaxID=3155299 RepID=UPI00341B21DB